MVQRSRRQRDRRVPTCVVRIVQGLPDGGRGSTRGIEVLDTGPWTWLGDLRIRRVVVRTLRVRRVPPCVPRTPVYWHRLSPRKSRRGSPARGSASADVKVQRLPGKPTKRMPVLNRPPTSSPWERPRMAADGASRSPGHGREPPSSPFRQALGSVRAYVTASARSMALPCSQAASNRSGSMRARRSSTSVALRCWEASETGAANRRPSSSAKP